MVPTYTWSQDQIWQYHWTPTTITTASTSTNVWQAWTTTTTGMTATASTITYVPADAAWHQWQIPAPTVRALPKRTPEEVQRQLDAEQRRREEASRRRLAAQNQLAFAQDRALDLLTGILTAEEALYRQEHGAIMVRGSDGGLFVIEERGVHGNIREIDEHGCVLGRACVAPSMYEERQALPLADGWIGQYLAAKFNEAELRRVANWSGRAPCRMATRDLGYAA